MSNDNLYSHASQKVAIEELRNDMVVARDVVSKWGAILIPMGAKLDSINYGRLKSNGISSIEVFGDTIDLKKPALNGEKKKDNKHVPIDDRPEFKEFVSEYNEKTEEIKNSLLAIGDGEVINLDKLYSLTDGIMSRLSCKSDVFTYLSHLKSTDEHTFTHSNNVALLCNLFGTWVGFDDEQIMNLTAAGVLHDLGKTKVDLEILNKKGKLTPEEFDHIKKHTIFGYQILEKQDLPLEIKLAALMHHEKIDGSGYPLGVKGDKICDFAKIVAICDIYDAMTANRVYRAKLCPFEVIRQFEQHSFGLLDTEYLLIFLQNIAYTYLGSWVKINDGRDAEIAFINKENLSRPIIKTAGGEIIDLNVRKDINIEYLV